MVLTDWNNTIIRLLPSAIVAKVGTSHFGDSELESLERELQIASHLAGRAAPVISPTRHVAAAPFTVSVDDGFRLGQRTNAAAFGAALDGAGIDA